MDTLKTALQVNGREALALLTARVRDAGVAELYAGQGEETGGWEGVSQRRGCVRLTACSSFERAFTPYRLLSLFTAPRTEAGTRGRYFFLFFIFF